jgi:hypothetical protein
MIRRSQLRLILHGALFMVISMTAGTPAFFIATHYAMNEPVRQFFRQSHSIFMVTGIWMIATGAALPLLELTERGIATLVWSLLVSGYTFLVALAVFFAALRIYPPNAKNTQWETLKATPYHLGWIYIGLVVVSGATSFLPGVLIVWGAWKAAKHSPLDAIH